MSTDKIGMYLSKAGNKDSMSFTSTGGGASLELLEGVVLPAFEVLEKKDY